MAKSSIHDITSQPMTGLRYGLADKLLRINTGDRFSPVTTKQVNGLIQVMSEAGVSINQQVHVESKCNEILGLIEENRHVAELVHDLIISLRLIQADNRQHTELNLFLEMLVREWNANVFPAEELKFLLGELKSNSKDKTLAQEIGNAQKAILTGQAPLDINLSTPEKQLVWAAHLLFLLYNPYLMQNWPPPIRKGVPNLPSTALWKQLTTCHHVRYLRILFGNHVFNLTRNNQIQLTWGGPGSWFSFSLHPEPGIISCDLLFSMLVGFDHARACVVHEISHAVQTKGIPDFVQEIANRMHENPGDEALRQELEMKQYFLNCAEDNCVNRFTQEVGKVFGQDYGYSLNYWYTAIGDVGRRYTKQEPAQLEDTPKDRFGNLTFIISRVFLAHNGLFKPDREGWESIMAIPEWISGRDRNNPDSWLDNDQSWKQLMEMCEEVEHYFPPLQDLASGPAHYGKQAELYAAKRFELIHELWKLYAEDLKNQIVEKQEDSWEDSQDRFNMEMNPSEPPPKKQKQKEKQDTKDEEKNQEQNPNPPTESDSSSENFSEEDLPGDPPEDQQEDNAGGGGEDGEDSSAGEDGSPQDSPDDSGQDGDSENQQAGGNDKSKQPKSPSEDTEKPAQDPNQDKSTEKGEEDGTETEESSTPSEPIADESAEKPMPEDEATQDAQDSQNVADPAKTEEPAQVMDPGELERLMQKLMDQFKELATMKEDAEAEPQAIQDEESPEAELIREMEDDAAEREANEDREQKNGTERGDAQGGDEFAKGVLESDFLPDEPMASVEDLMKALEDSMQEASERKSLDREGRLPMFEEEDIIPRPKLEIPPQMSLDQLASGDWDDFNKRVALHGPVIAVMARALAKLKDAQLKIIFKQSKKHSIVPEGGDLRRFDHQAMQRLLMQISKAEKFQKDDLSLFKKDGKIAAATRPTRVILIDGSRSMSMGSRPLPMDKAIQEAVIDYMASRVAGYDTYIAMFGPLNPILLAEPGDHLVEIGKRIEQVHGGLNTMTYLAPALMLVIERIAYRKRFQEPFVGFTNFVIYSDGDIDDARQAREIIQQIILHAPKSTFDFVLITNKHATPMDVLIRTLEFRNPIHEVGVVRSLAQRPYPLALTSTMKLTQRLGKTRSGYADQAFLRGAQFKRLLALLTRGKPE